MGLVNLLANPHCKLALPTRLVRGKWALLTGLGNALGTMFATAGIWWVVEWLGV